MSNQRTFRDVAKPEVRVLSAALSGGVLALDQGTFFRFTGPAVGTVVGLSGHQYLIDGQEVYVENAHATADLIFTIGAFNYTVPAGYSATLYFNKNTSSFYGKTKDADLKVLENNISANATAISQEVTNRQADTATLLKLDGSRTMTGSLKMGTHKIAQVVAAENSDEVIIKAQFDTAVADLTSQIAANATALKWRKPVSVITKITSRAIPSNGEVLADYTFSGGSSRLFEDDEAPSLFLTATFPVGSTVIFVKDGQEPKLMIVRDVMGAKKWFDHTEADVSLKVDRAIAADDTFIVKADLLDSPDNAENQAIYHVEAGTPKSLIKIGDLDWDQATGINIAASYSAGPGGETVVAGDSVQSAVAKLDGNVKKEITDRISDVNTKIAQEVTDRNSAITTAINAEVVARNTAISTSQTAQNQDLASTSAGKGASLVGINDATNLITATTVEGALVENRQKIDQNTSDITAVQSTVASHTAAIAQHDTQIATNAANITALETNLASTAAGKGASKVGIEDAGSNYVATTVEGALNEIFVKVANLKLVQLARGLHEVVTTGGTSLNLATAFVNTLGAGSVVVNLADASYLNVSVNRDGAMLIGEVGFTLAGGVLTFTEAGGGELTAGEVVEVKIIRIS